MDALAAGGLVTLRSGFLPLRIGAVALIGGVGFCIAFLTTLDGTADGCDAAGTFLDVAAS
jgi:hypothetical protein